MKTKPSSLSPFHPTLNYMGENVQLLLTQRETQKTETTDCTDKISHRGGWKQEERG